MTEKNADVEWLRGTLSMMAPRPGQRVSLSRKQAESILAHIDQLEAEAAACRSNCEDLSVMVNAQQDRRRPTVHEIAAQIMSGMFASPWFGGETKESAVRKAYAAAEALVAEGRRRDGL